MSRTKILEIDGRKHELFFSTRVMMKLSERCGSIEDLGDWLSAEKEDGGTDTAEMMRRYSIVIAELANGAVVKHNADISLGLEDGEKRQLYPEDYFIDVLSAGDLLEYKDIIYDAMNIGNEFEVPHGIELTQRDEELAEIEAEARKNSESVQT